jgi:hypothetical protein
LSESTEHSSDDCIGAKFDLRALPQLLATTDPNKEQAPRRACKRDRNNQPKAKSVMRINQHN